VFVVIIILYLLCTLHFLNRHENSDIQRTYDIDVFSIDVRKKYKTERTSSKWVKDWCTNQQVYSYPHSLATQITVISVHRSGDSYKRVQSHVEHWISTKVVR
jgi:hypothetical protein